MHFPANGSIIGSEIFNRRIAQTMPNEFAFASEPVGYSASPRDEEDGPSFDSVPFVILPGRQVVLNGLYAIPDAAGRRAHYGRVVGGYEANRDAEPGRLQHASALRIEMPMRRGDDSLFLHRLAVMEVLGELEFGDGDPPAVRVLPPTHLPQTGRPVYPLSGPLAELLLGFPPPEEGLELGRAYGSDAAVALPRSALPRHILIVGRPGTGKSYARGVLAEEIARHGIPQVNFDANGEMAAAAEELGGVNLVPGRDYKVPLWALSEFELLSLQPNLTQAHQDLIVDAYVDLSEKKDVWTWQELADEIRRVGKAVKARDDVIDRAVSRLGYGIRQNAIIGELGDWSALLRRYPFVNVLLGGLKRSQREIVVAATARLLQRSRLRGEIPPFVFGLDEAHLFLPAGGKESPSTAVIREFVRMGRHMKIGVILVSQSPLGIDRQVMLLCNTRVIFALDGEDLRAMSGFLADAPRQMVERIPKLGQGLAVLSGGAELVRHTLLVEIRERRTSHGAPTPDLKEEVEAWLREKPE